MGQNTRHDLLQGTLDLLILRTLRAGPQHGWAISEKIQQISEDVLRVNQGSLYPALHRLEHEGLDQSRMGGFRTRAACAVLPVDTSGRKQLEAETEAWSRMALAIGRVLEMA